MVHCTSAAQSFSLVAIVWQKECGTARFHTLPGDGAHVSVAGISR
ncbi:hypothetical protein FHW71_000550 [Enterobacter sp. Sphag1F]|jgi:hypothetical protein|nr:hypothetical protein [Enterobacter sp. Sphag1F]NYI12848.1 hypothetical protein [Enterobacter sp. Sphag71]